MQSLVKSTRFYPYIGSKTEGKYSKSQSRDKILYILLVFALYLVMIVDK